MLHDTRGNLSENGLSVVVKASMRTAVDDSIISNDVTRTTPYGSSSIKSHVWMACDTRLTFVAWFEEKIIDDEACRVDEHVCSFNTGRSTVISVIGGDGGGTDSAA